MPRAPTPAEAALIETHASRTQDPERWRQAVWQWVEDPEEGLAIVLWRRLQAWHRDGQAVWPPEHAPRGECPYTANAKARSSASADAADVLGDQVHEIARRLIDHGLPQHWDPAGAPLAVFLTEQVLHAARRCIAQLVGSVGKGCKQVSLDQPTEPDDPDAPPLLQVPGPDYAAPSYNTGVTVRLHPDADPRQRAIQVAGMQQQPRLDWDRDPAPRLKDILCREVIVPGRAEGRAWQALLAAHEAAAARYHAKRELLLAEIHRLHLNGHLANEQRRRLGKLDGDFLLQPLEAKDLQRLTEWSMAAVYQNVSRYLAAWHEGDLEVVRAAE